MGHGLVELCYKGRVSLLNTHRTITCDECVISSAVNRLRSEYRGNLLEKKDGVDLSGPYLVDGVLLKTPRSPIIELSLTTDNVKQLEIVSAMFGLPYDEKKVFYITPQDDNSAQE